MSLQSLHHPIHSLPMYAAQTEIACPAKNIPFELVLLCFFSLSAKEIAQVSRVCKKWHWLSKSHSLWQRLIAPFPLNAQVQESPFTIFSKTPWVLHMASAIQQQTFILKWFDPTKRVGFFPKIESKTRFTLDLNSFPNFIVYDSHNNIPLKTIDSASFLHFWDSRVLITYSEDSQIIYIEDLTSFNPRTTISLEQGSVLFKRDISEHKQFLLLPVAQGDSFEANNYLCFDLEQKKLLATTTLFNHTPNNKKIVCNDTAIFQLTTGCLSIKSFSNPEIEKNFSLPILLKKANVTTNNSLHKWKPQELFVFEGIVVAQISGTVKDNSLLYIGFDTKTEKLISAFHI